MKLRLHSVSTSMCTHTDGSSGLRPSGMRRHLKGRDLTLPPLPRPVSVGLRGSRSPPSVH